VAPSRTEAGWPGDNGRRCVNGVEDADFGWRAAGLLRPAAWFGTPTTVAQMTVAAHRAAVARRVVEWRAMAQTVASMRRVDAARRAVGWRVVAVVLFQIFCQVTRRRNFGRVGGKTRAVGQNGTFIG
jgi:hypothetical protein